MRVLKIRNSFAKEILTEQQGWLLSQRINTSPLNRYIGKEINNKLTNKANYFFPKGNLAIYLMVYLYTQNSVQSDSFTFTSCSIVY